MLLGIAVFLIHFVLTLQQSVVVFQKKLQHFILALQDHLCAEEKSSKSTLISL